VSAADQRKRVCLITKSWHIVASGESMNPAAPLPPHQEFELRLKALSRDARAAARFTYIGEAIGFSSAQQPQLIARLNEFAGFWNTVLGALQTSAIVALGRMYDRSNKVLSARKLLDYATANLGLFSADSLRARLATRLTAPAEVDAYMEDVRPPTQAQFGALTAALDEHTALYKEKIKVIRHRVFAHAGRITQEELHAIFAAVPVADFERLTVFPLLLYDALWETYANGLNLALSDMPTAIAELIANPLGQRAVGKEHQHAVQDTTEFLESLAPTNGEESGRR